MSQCFNNPKIRISEIRANLKSERAGILKNIPQPPFLTNENEELLNYNDLQNVNEFFRTQLGHYVQVDCFIGAGEIISKYGYLIKVGLDYIILQDKDGKYITSIDFWSIKFMYVYYDVETLETFMPFAQ